MNICDRIAAADNGYGTIYSFAFYDSCEIINMIINNYRPKDGLKSILKQLNSNSTSAACKALSVFLVKLSIIVKINSILLVFILEILFLVAQCVCQ